MDELLEKMSAFAISSVSISTLENAIAIMRSKNVLTVSVEELLQFIIHAEKVGNNENLTAASDNHKAVPEISSSPKDKPSTPPNASTSPQSPTFTFKTPSKLFAEETTAPVGATATKQQNKNTNLKPEADISIESQVIDDLANIKFDIGDSTVKTGVKAKRPGLRSARKPATAIKSGVSFANENAYHLSNGINVMGTGVKSAATNSSISDIPVNPFNTEMKRPFNIDIEGSKMESKYDVKDNCTTPFRPAGGVSFAETPAFNTTTPFASKIKQPSFPFNLNANGTEKFDEGGIKFANMQTPFASDTPESTVEMEESNSPANDSFCASNLNDDIKCAAQGEDNDDEDDSLLLFGFNQQNPKANSFAPVAGSGATASASEPQVVKEMNNLFAKVNLDPHGLPIPPVPNSFDQQQLPLPPQTPSTEFKFNMGVGSVSHAKKATTPYAMKKKAAKPTVHKSATEYSQQSVPPPPPATFPEGPQFGTQDSKFSLPKSEADVPPMWWNGLHSENRLPSMFSYASMNGADNGESDSQSSSDSEPSSESEDEGQVKSSSQHIPETANMFWGNVPSASANASVKLNTAPIYMPPPPPQPSNFAFPSFVSTDNISASQQTYKSSDAKVSNSNSTSSLSPNRKYTVNPEKLRATLHSSDSSTAAMPPPPPAPAATVATAAATSPRPSSASAPLPTTPTRSTSEDSGATQNMASLAELYRKQGKELYSEHEDYEKALGCFDKSLKFAPANWQYRSVVLGNRAAVYFMLERYPECVSDCDAALLLDPKLYRLHVRKGKALLRMGEVNAAEESMNRVLEIDASAVDNHKDLEPTKVEAKGLVKNIASVKLSMKNISQFEVGDDYKTIVKIADELLQTMPASRAVHVFKAKALVRQNSYSAGKKYIESVITTIHSNVLAVHAHPKASFTPSINIASLVVKEASTSASAASSSSKGSLIFDSASILNAILCMGSDLAKLYICCLKNTDDCRSCCGDLMDRIAGVLMELSAVLNPTDPFARTASSSSATSHGMDFNDWLSWAPAECARVKEMVLCKNSGDKNYRMGHYAAATADYLRAIQIDKEAIRWSAILYTNRAAALMSQTLYAEAIADCHSAIVKDPGHFKAYLRRARAHAALNQHAAAVRDYRMYLSSHKELADGAEVKAELEALQELQRKILRENQSRHQQEQFNRPPTSSSTSSSAGNAEQKPAAGPRPNTSTGTRSKFTSNQGNQAGAGNGTGQQNSNRTGFGNGGRPSSSYAKQSVYSDDDDDVDDEDDFFSRHYQYSSRRNSTGSHNPFDRKSTSGSSSHTSSSSGAGSGAGGSGANSHNRRSSTSGSQHNGHNKSSAASEPKEGDLYSTLGITKSATERQIKTAYRQLALKYHPDKNKEEGAEDKFKTITAAYSVLSDKTSRDKYDRERLYR